MVVAKVSLGTKQARSHRLRLVKSSQCAIVSMNAPRSHTHLSFYI